jgi:hypothetical protein
MQSAKALERLAGIETPGFEINDNREQRLRRASFGASREFATCHFRSVA